MYLSLSLRRSCEICELAPEKGGKNKACPGLTASTCCSAAFRRADLLKAWSREVHLSAAEVSFEPLSNSIGHGSVTGRTDLKNTHTHEHRGNFHASRQRSFSRVKHDFCATVDRSTGTVPHTKVGAQYHFSECQDLVHRLIRQSHSRPPDLAAARHHQGTPNNCSLREQCVPCAL